ncbi:protocatechuate 3,4-dioxygenase [Roseomonas stagni]|uniref:Protocatechuate 3,4-dioxygenase n=1 Tax=Falsiroseomonas algicola TaxID=2716930 RepID=A0A6M1LEA9_9PROT|nr:class III extradiol dioxygenase family protein [Falsiroseomonas algicola]NGM18638.1 protocatechuate 3,4-dioxygenase [Falsiroseomonas algicola]
MARIIGGIGITHSPAAIFAHDKGLGGKPDWAPFFEPLAQARAWLEAARPDLILCVYNDHLNHFFFDAYPSFAIGVADEFPLAPEAGAIPAFPPIPGDFALAARITEAMVARDFDLTVCQELALDHGAAGPLRMLAEPWPAPVVPIFVNVLRAPVPRPARLYALGRALAEAVAALPDDLRVVVVATGGLSHQLHGPRGGEINEEWDLDFLARLPGEGEALAALTTRDYVVRGGAEGAETVMWLAMRGALPDAVRPVVTGYLATGSTGLGLLVLEAG